MISTMNLAGLILLSYAVAFMQFSQSAYTQNENNSPLSVSLVLDPFWWFRQRFSSNNSGYCSANHLLKQAILLQVRK